MKRTRCFFNGSEAKLQNKTGLTRSVKFKLASLTYRTGKLGVDQREEYTMTDDQKKPDNQQPNGGGR